jgi:glutamate N-acetyltransferase/amino-acid N-acetyltransferase
MAAFQFKQDSAGCVDTPGFAAAGVHCDVRGTADGRLDLALVISEEPCTLAAVFTRNRVAAAPVRLGRQTLAAATFVRGFAANSGNANACTGPEGMQDALKMRELAARAAGCRPEEILVCSTGRIGRRLPLDKMEKGFALAGEQIENSTEAGVRAADAILTSDTRRKVCSVRVETSPGFVHISGMAKGAGMIEPNMATMLGFICTDAKVEPPDLQAVLAESVDASFNAVTVDGDESTNDTVLLLANGTSGIPLAPGSGDWNAFKSALQAVCQDLAKKIVGDGEKITKVVELRIEGAATESDARKAARAVANSLLVKSSWYGCDPNWGRIMDALGYSGADLSEETVSLWYEDSHGEQRLPVYARGRILDEHLDGWKAIVAAPRFRIIADLGSGSAAYRMWSTDLTEGYVNFNKSE